MDLLSWLEHIRQQHRKVIDLDLGRVSVVSEKLGLIGMPCPVVTVGGTNGKGSTVAGLEAIWLAAGYRVGAFTSPWLYRFNELIRVQGQSVTDEQLVEAFCKIEAARGDVTLTIFEFNTLAALLIFRASALDVVILEVGLGGRLDAVNIVSAEVSVVTSIALDHTEWLGNTREAIAAEKAGIFRSGRPAVCGDLFPPRTLRQTDASLFVQGESFGFVETGQSWSFWSGETVLEQLPRPSLLLQNMATVLQVITLMQACLPVSREMIGTGLQNIHLPGRIQVIPGVVTEIRDVSHNPAAVQPLADYLREQAISGKTWAVFSMLRDKDIAGTLEVIRDQVDGWFVAPIKDERAASLSRLQHEFSKTGISTATFFDTLKEAFGGAKKHAAPRDRLVVFGSFHTLSAL